MKQLCPRTQLKTLYAFPLIGIVLERVMTMSYFTCLFWQKYVKNVPAYLHSRKELHSSVFEDLQEHRFFQKHLLSKYYMVRITT